MKIKIAVSYQCTCTKMSEIKKTEDTKCWLEEPKHPSTVGSRVKWDHHFGNLFIGFL